MYTRKSESTVFPTVDMSSDVVLVPLNIKTEKREEIDMYVYDEAVYDKNEYIMMLIEKNTADTQYIGMMTEVL